MKSPELSIIGIFTIVVSVALLTSALKCTPSQRAAEFPGIYAAIEDAAPSIDALRANVTRLGESLKKSTSSPDFATVKESALASAATGIALGDAIGKVCEKLGEFAPGRCTEVAIATDRLRETAKAAEAILATPPLEKLEGLIVPEGAGQ